MDATDGTRDPETREYTKLYPLGLNPIAKVCRVHRSVMIGMLDSYDTAPVQMSFWAADDTDQARTSARLLSSIVNGTWRASDGASTIPEAALLTQVHSGHVFKVAFEPDNRLLPYRLRSGDPDGKAVTRDGSQDQE